MSAVWVRWRQFFQKGGPAAAWACRAASTKATMPDFNTSVATHEHSIKLGTRRSQRLDEMKERTKGSLVPASLKHVAEDEEHKETAENLRKMGQERLTLEERKKRRRALDSLGVPSFHEFLSNKGKELVKTEVEILQINIGLYCNQACNHCHVESSPKRKETMSAEVADRCIELLRSTPSVKTLDITGGAPELNEQFRRVVVEGRKLGIEVIDRCNLTVLSEPGQEDLAQFLAENRVRIVASLPCYSAKNVDTQRGAGVFEKSITGLLSLNQLGLDLIYNPLGAFLPPDQKALELQYKKQLGDDFGIVFNNLFTLSNMPIKRFADFLHKRGELQKYMELLVRNFNTSTVDGLMCTNLVSVDYNGYMYDCDFNQQLAVRMEKEGLCHPSIFDVTSLNELKGLKVATDNHCFGCTAGNGSSCQGTTV